MTAEVRGVQEETDEGALSLEGDVISSRSSTFNIQDKFAPGPRLANSFSIFGILFWSLIKGCGMGTLFLFPRVLGEM